MTKMTEDEKRLEKSLRRADELGVFEEAKKIHEKIRKKSGSKKAFGVKDF